jgi:hypothetical protein
VKLLKRVVNAEREEASHNEVIPSLVWTSDEQTLGDAVAFLSADQHVALDVYLLEGPAPVVEGEDPAVPAWRTVERVSDNPEDLGLLYSETGLPVGRVTAIHGPLIDVRYYGSAAGG